MGRIRKFAVEMTRRVNRGESQTGPSPALGNPHQTPVPTFPQRWRRRAAWQRQSPTPLKSGPLTDSCTEPQNQRSGFREHGTLIPERKKRAYPSSLSPLTSDFDREPNQRLKDVRIIFRYLAENALKHPSTPHLG